MDLVHFLGHYYDSGVFWTVMVTAATIVIGGVLTWYFARRFYERQKREAALQVAQQSRKLDALGQRLGQMQAYLDGLPTSAGLVRASFDAGMAAMKAYQWDEAIRHFSAAAKHATGTQLVGLLNLIGLCNYTPGRLRQALESYEESARLAERFGDAEGKAAALGNVGIVLQDRGKYKEALKYHRDSLAIARENKDARCEVNQLGNIGLVYLYLGERLKAAGEFERVLDTSHKMGWHDSVAQALNGLGLVYQNMGEFDKALRCHYESLEISRTLRDRRGEAIDLGNIGLVLAVKGEYVQAVPRLAEALTLASAVGMADPTKQSLTALVCCQIELGGQRLRELCEEAGLSDEAITALENMIRSFRQAGRRAAS